MHVITTAAAIDAVTAPPLRAILDRYVEMIELATIYIIEPGDTLDSLAQARGRPFDLWEFIDDRCGWYEAVVVLTDDGAGHVVLIPDRPDIDPELLALCRDNAGVPIS